MRISHGQRVVAAALLFSALTAAVGGCTKKILITQYPAFYTRDLQTMAVIPFKNQTRWRNAGDIVSDKLAAALVANGAYTVYNRNHFKTLMDESDLRLAFGGDPTAAAAAFKKHTDVTAILTGAVTTFAATTKSQRRKRPVYAYRSDGSMYVSGYTPYVFTRNQATVSVTATLIRVADGATIHATPAVGWQVASQGSPPRKDVNVCLAEATNVVVGRLLETFAPIRKIIKVNPSKALRIASDFYDNEWTFTDTLDAQTDKMQVVLALPSNCDRNRFRITIIRKGQREDLASRDIVWSGKYSCFGYAFDVRDIAQKGGGPGEYEAKFYSGQKPVLRRTFKIR